MELLMSGPKSFNARSSSPTGPKRGNTTAGADRKGGRYVAKRVYPKDTPTFQVLLTLSDNECAAAITLGDGVLTRGLRAALAIAAETLPPGSPQTRLEAEFAALDKKAERRKIAMQAKKRTFTGKKTRASAYGAPPPKEELARMVAEFRAKRLADQAAGVTEPADDDENEGKVLVGVQVIVPRVADELDKDTWDDLGSDEESTT